MRVKAVKVLAALIRKTLGSQPTRFPEDVSVLTQQQEILLWIPAASVLKSAHSLSAGPAHLQAPDGSCPNSENIEGHLNPLG